MCGASVCASRWKSKSKTCRLSAQRKKKRSLTRARTDHVIPGEVEGPAAHARYCNGVPRLRFAALGMTAPAKLQTPPRARIKTRDGNGGKTGSAQASSRC